MYYALCDCNNFFVSCERVFRPDLEGKPVVVLSGNDGCVVSRSNEAKKLGIKMGEPWFEVKRRLGERQEASVTAFSSNFSLYGDLSSRVMSLLAKHTPRLEQYSIDEAFLHCDHLPIHDLKPYYEQVVKQIRKWVGIPVSIGLAPTRTLAKIASKYAKQYPAYNGVCIIDTDEKRQKALQGFAIEDVWGIGRQAQKKLLPTGIVTACDFSQRLPEFAKNLLHKPGLQTWQELNGYDCIDITERAERQSISQSRTFERGITDQATLEKALVDFMSDCADKLRKQRSLCRQFSVYAHTSRFAEEEMQVIHQIVTLPFPTAITAELVGYMLAALRKQWRPYPYKKAGVVLMGLTPADNAQQMLFDERPKERDERLQKAIDHINSQYGKTALKVATQVLNTDQPLTKREKLSPCYTTNLRDILVLKC
ncbi:MAG: Y-family DNA polymerase [Bacteroidales bacterium]|nr:Y-family DNA polymerase [Bacteroidales bacterium]